MKRYKFIIHTGYPGCDHETEDVFDDDVTEKDLDAYLNEFVLEVCDGYYEEITEGDAE